MQLGGSGAAARYYSGMHLSRSLSCVGRGLLPLPLLQLIAVSTPLFFHSIHNHHSSSSRNKLGPPCRVLFSSLMRFVVASKRHVGPSSVAMLHRSAPQPDLQPVPQPDLQRDNSEADGSARGLTQPRYSRTVHCGMRSRIAHRPRLSPSARHLFLLELRPHSR